MYRAKYNIDPTPLVQDHYMSDEALGPEDGETVDDWQIRMANASNMKGDRMKKHELKQHKFLEVIRPEWRSQEVSTKKSIKRILITV